MGAPKHKGYRRTCTIIYFTNHSFWYIMCNCTRSHHNCNFIIVQHYHMTIFPTFFLLLTQSFIFLQAGCRKDNTTTPLEPVYPVSSNGELFPWAQYRLPQSIQPLSYDLTLNPDISNMTFTGRVVIDMLVRHNTNRLVLHSANLNISKATFKV